MKKALCFTCSLFVIFSLVLAPTAFAKTSEVETKRMWQRYSHLRKSETVTDSQFLEMMELAMELNRIERAGNRDIHICNWDFKPSVEKHITRQRIEMLFQNFHRYYSTYVWFAVNDYDVVSQQEVDSWITEWFDKGKYQKAEAKYALLLYLRNDSDNLAAAQAYYNLHKGELNLKVKKQLTWVLMDSFPNWSTAQGLAKRTYQEIEKPRERVMFLYTLHGEGTFSWPENKTVSILFRNEMTSLVPELKTFIVQKELLRESLWNALSRIKNRELQEQKLMEIKAIDKEIKQARTNFEYVLAKLADISNSQ
jgi:hypothetical protein